MVFNSIYLQFAIENTWYYVNVFSTQMVFYCAYSAVCLLTEHNTYTGDLSIPHPGPISFLTAAEWDFIGRRIYSIIPC